MSITPPFRNIIACILILLFLHTSKLYTGQKMSVINCPVKEVPFMHCPIHYKLFLLISFIGISVVYCSAFGTPASLNKFFYFLQNLLTTKQVNDSSEKNLTEQLKTKTQPLPIIDKSATFTNEISKICNTYLEWINHNVEENFKLDANIIRDLTFIVAQTKKHFSQQKTTVTFYVVSPSDSLVLEFLLLKIFIAQQFPIEKVFIKSQNLNNIKQQFEKIEFSDQLAPIPSNNNALLILATVCTPRSLQETMHIMQGTNSIFFDVHRKPFSSERFIYANIIPLPNDDEIDMSDETLKKFNSWIFSRISSSIQLFFRDEPLNSQRFISLKTEQLTQFFTLITSLIKASVKTDQYIKNMELLKKQYNQIIDCYSSDAFQKQYGMKIDLDTEKFVLSKSSSSVEKIYDICNSNINLIREKFDKKFQLYDQMIDEISLIIDHLEKNKIEKTSIKKFYGLGSGIPILEFLLLTVLNQFGYTKIDQIFVADLSYADNNSPIKKACDNFKNHFSTKKIQVTAYDNVTKIPLIKNDEKDKAEALIIAQSPDAEVIYAAAVRIMAGAPDSVFFAAKNSKMFYQSVLPPYDKQLKDYNFLEKQITNLLSFITDYNYCTIDKNLEFDTSDVISKYLQPMARMLQTINRLIQSYEKIDQQKVIVYKKNFNKLKKRYEQIINIYKQKYRIAHQPNRFKPLSNDDATKLKELLDKLEQYKNFNNQNLFQE